MNYVKPYSDIFVKYLFGSQGNEDILLHFINAVLSDSESKRISDVAILNPFNLQSFSKDKLSILDVKARDETDRLYNIEIQSTSDEGFKHRILYYWAKLYSYQLKPGESYLLLRPTISINIVNFRLIEECDDIHNWFYLAKNKDCEIIFSDHLFIHFLELIKLSKSIESLTILERWLYFFRYEGKEGYDMKLIIRDDEVFHKAHDVYERFTKDEELKDLYESREEAERQHLTSLEIAEQKGIEKGEVNKQLEIARAMLKDGTDIDLISKYTGLSEDQIRKLT